jgi:hypothetical protein
MPENFAAQTQRLRLAKDAYLELQPDPLIPHRGSRFLTDTTIEIDPSATLYYSEILMSGRKYHHEDESFGWDVFSSIVTAARPDRSGLFVEKFVIQPKRNQIRRLGVMGPYEVFGNAILLTPKQNADRVLARTGAGITAEIAFRQIACRTTPELFLRHSAWSPTQSGRSYTSSGALPERLSWIARLPTDGFTGIAQVFLVQNVATGVIFLLALSVSSVRAAAFALAASMVAVAVASQLGADSTLITAGLFGFSPAIAVGTVFNWPGLRVGLYAFIATVFTVLVQAALNVFVEPLGIPTLTAPFVLATWLFLLPRENFAPVPNAKTTGVV